jgi:hypothetical protein
MGFAAVVIVAVFVLAVVLVARASARKRAGAFAAFGGAGNLSGSAATPWNAPMSAVPLLQNGAVARGILLKVSAQRSAKGTQAAGLYEVRLVTIDVEIPGRAPYQTDCSIAVPARLCRLIVPGATLELRVNPNDRNAIAVFGPGVGLAVTS